MVLPLLLGHIRVSGGDLDVFSVSRPTYTQLEDEWVREPSPADGCTFDEYADEKGASEAALRTALSTDWSDLADFEVAWDENVAFTLCGSVYTTKIVCRDYLDVVHRVLQSTRMKHRWIYHTALELLSPCVEIPDCGFVLQGNQIFVNMYTRPFDFIKYFSRSKAEAASTCAGQNEL
jgi:hypothetical protein